MQKRPRNKKRLKMAVFELITIDELSIKVRLEKETMELFSIPVPARQQEFVFEDQDQVRVLDNPLEDNLRNYVVWGRL